MAKADLSAQRLRELLHYDPDTGVFTRLVRTSNALGGRVGDVAGGIGHKGYWIVGLLNRHWRAHRLAWLYVYGEWPNGIIDHINGDPADNRIANLRDVSNAQNIQNERRPRSNNTSGMAGVSRSGNGPYWRASLKVNGRPRHLGTFKTVEEAHAAYLEAKRRHHSGFLL